MRGLVALASGLLFGFGLLLSGMANPAKVLGFLDLAGAWDPSLALVMVGAIAVALLPLQWIQRRGTTLQLPSGRQIDRRLVMGSLLFGAGWGVAGFCPGPALVAAAALIPQALLFVAAMLVGMVLFSWFDRRGHA